MGTEAFPAADASKQEICWTYLCLFLLLLEGNVRDVREEHLWLCFHARDLLNGIGMLLIVVWFRKYAKQMLQFTVWKRKVLFGTAMWRTYNHF